MRIVTGIVETARAVTEQKLALALGACALVLTFSRGASALESSISSALLQAAADGARRATADARTAVELVPLSATTGRGAALALGVHDNALPFARHFAELSLAAGPFLTAGPFLAGSSAALERPNLLLLPSFLTLGSPSGGIGGAWAKELAASTPYNDPRLGCAGPCTEAMPGLSLPSTWVASMAVIGLGVGMGLAMSSSKSERRGLPPIVRFKLAFRKAVATTTLRF